MMVGLTKKSSFSSQVGLRHLHNLCLSTSGFLFGFFFKCIYPCTIHERVLSSTYKGRGNEGQKSQVICPRLQHDLWSHVLTHYPPFLPIRKEPAVCPLVVMWSHHLKSLGRGEGMEMKARKATVTHCSKHRKKYRKGKLQPTGPFDTKHPSGMHQICWLAIRAYQLISKHFQAHSWNCRLSVFRHNHKH